MSELREGRSFLLGNAGKADGLKRRKEKEKAGPKTDSGASVTNAGQKDTLPDGVPSRKGLGKARAR